MWPFGNLGAALGNLLASPFNAAMAATWTASLALLHAAFGVVDQFSVFSVSTTSGPIGAVWPVTLWVSGALALGLFFWQLIMTNLKAGHGFVRLVTGPAQYGVVLAVLVGLVAAFLAAADGITNGILDYGLRVKTFSDALSHTSLTSDLANSVHPAILGLCAIFGVLPAAVGYLLEMLFRQAAVLTLVAAAPVAAAGLLANVTAAWFWRTGRWIVVAIATKPAVALILVIGVAAEGRAQGAAGLLAGIGVLLISLLAPFVLFRLFAFIDPQSDAGAAFRNFLSGAGMDSYGPNNPASALAKAAGGTGDAEQANTGRFDQALASYSDGSMDGTGISAPDADSDDDGHGNGGGSSSNQRGQSGMDGQSAAGPAPSPSGASGSGTDNEPVDGGQSPTPAEGAEPTVPGAGVPVADAGQLPRAEGSAGSGLPGEGEAGGAESAVIA